MGRIKDKVERGRVGNRPLPPPKKRVEEEIRNTEEKMHRRGNVIENKKQTRTKRKTETGKRPRKKRKRHTKNEENGGGERTARLGDHKRERREREAVHGGQFRLLPIELNSYISSTGIKRLRKSRVRAGAGKHSRANLCIIYDNAARVGRSSRELTCFSSPTSGLSHCWRVKSRPADLNWDSGLAQRRGEEVGTEKGRERNGWRREREGQMEVMEEEVKRRKERGG